MRSTLLRAGWLCKKDRSGKKDFRVAWSASNGSAKILNIYSLLRNYLNIDLQVAGFCCAITQYVFLYFFILDTRSNIYSFFILTMKCCLTYRRDIYLSCKFSIPSPFYFHFARTRVVNVLYRQANILSRPFTYLPEHHLHTHIHICAYKPSPYLSCCKINRNPRGALDALMLFATTINVVFLKDFLTD